MKPCFKVHMKLFKLGKMEPLLHKRAQTARLNIRRIKPYNIPKIELNISIESINIHVSSTYNVTPIPPYI